MDSSSSSLSAIELRLHWFPLQNQTHASGFARNVQQQSQLKYINRIMNFLVRLGLDVTSQTCPLQGLMFLQHFSNVSKFKC